MATEILNEREIWLAGRRAGIGSSDIAAVCGVSPWKTALDVWMDKRGLTEDSDSVDKRMGRKLEPIVCSEYAERMGVELIAPVPQMQHALYPFILANLDAMWADRSRIVECKAPSFHMRQKWGEQGTDDVPEEYLMQVQHQMFVSGIDVCDVAALIAGRELRVYTIHKNQRLADLIVEQCCEFWRCVEENEPPAPEFEHSSTSRMAAVLFGRVQDGECVPLDDDALCLWERYRAIGSQVSALDKERAAIKARIDFAIGQAAVGILPDKRELRRSVVERKSYTVAPTSYVMIREYDPGKSKKGK